MMLLARFVAASRAALFSAGLLLAAAPAIAQTPQIHASWNGGVLNVDVSNVPPNSPIGVTVSDMSHGSEETPNGSPPSGSDGAGNWPGGSSGGQTGYPGTAADEGGTHYVICVRVNGRTGPCMDVWKPRGVLGSITHTIITIGGLLGDARPAKLPRWDIAV
ncbi:MAG: hypothetical protein HYR85_27975 [Planctomycetes bacterium]|nr:hypothetical protein [Planctomycetota bacterium]MBI3846117.1 hypothetical protein [Planctomycetota bacterium]